MRTALFWVITQREPTFRDNLSVRKYHYSLRNNPEERSSHPLRGGSLKSRTEFFVSSEKFQMKVVQKINTVIPKIEPCRSLIHRRRNSQIGHRRSNKTWRTTGVICLPGNQGQSTNYSNNTCVYYLVLSTERNFEVKCVLLDG